MGRDRKQPTKQSNPPQTTVASSVGFTKRSVAITFLLAGFVGAIIMYVSMRLAASLVRPAPSEARISLGDLLVMSPEQLAKVDVAEMNLVCAAGLPGAEKLDVQKTLATLDQWANHVKSETERLLFRVNDPKTAEHYGKSEARYRAEMLVQVLQEDCGVRYHDGFDPNLETTPIFKSSKDCFLHGLVIDGNGGNCVSMPVVYVAVARRLGYPVKFVTSREHTFCRWEGMDHCNPAWRDRFNFDAPGKGFSIDPDEFYLTWPKPSTPQQVEANQWLKSLSASEERALFLLMRGHVLRDNNRFSDAQVAYAVANQLWPKSRCTAFWLAKIVDDQFHLSATASAPPAAPARRLTAYEIEAQRLAAERINAENMRLSRPDELPALPGSR